jgi:hypothetical protein
VHFPLVLAILACLVLVLLPVLDRSAHSEINGHYPRSYWSRLARWVQR